MTCLILLSENDKLITRENVRARYDAPNVSRTEPSIAIHNIDDGNWINAQASSDIKNRSRKEARCSLTDI